MRLLDKQYTLTPFYGVIKMTNFLRRLGHKIGKHKVRTLLRKMGLIAVYPEPKTSKKHPGNKVYPYLLRGLNIIRPNQVWAADITYIRLAEGFAYLVAIIDWFSRYVLSWQLSNALDADFCVEALGGAFKYGRCDIFNSDQGVQFTSKVFTEKLLAAQIKISMDGRGRVFDNIFVERLWRSVKYEKVYLNNYRTIPEARLGLQQYFKLYNTERLHEALNYNTPWEVYSGLKFGICSL